MVCASSIKVGAEHWAVGVEGRLCMPHPLRASRWPRRATEARCRDERHVPRYCGQQPRSHGLSGLSQDRQEPFCQHSQEGHASVFGWVSGQDAQLLVTWCSHRSGTLGCIYVPTVRYTQHFGRFWRKEVKLFWRWHPIQTVGEKKCSPPQVKRRGQLCYPMSMRWWTGTWPIWKFVWLILVMLLLIFCSFFHLPSFSLALIQMLLPAIVSHGF